MTSSREYSPIGSESKDITSTRLTAMENSQYSPSKSLGYDRSQEDERSRIDFPSWKQQPKPQSGSNARIFFIVSLVVAILVVATMVFLTSASSCPRSTTSISTALNAQDVYDYEPCGTTRKEALARGCKFDLMSFIWTPPACHDQQLLDEFLALREWSWYHDIKGIREAEVALVHQGMYEHLYVTWEYHKIHCAYMWRKLHRAMMVGSLVDGYVGFQNHTRHCLGQLDRTGIDPQKINTHIIQKFPRCGV